MNRYIIHSLFLLCVVCTSGCSKFMDRQPNDTTSSDQFWESRADFDEALTAIYGLLQSGEFSKDRPNFDALADNGYGQFSYGSSMEIVEGNIDPTTGGYVAGMYDLCFRGIARVNIFLKHLNEYVGTDIPSDDKKNYEAEVRFMRGVYYYYLHEYYGAVPLVLEPLDLDNQIQPKVDADKIEAQAEEDIDFAIENLPDVPYAESGHVVRNAAKAFKCRMLMYIAYDRSGNPLPEKLTEVRDLCKEIMGSATLSEKYSDIFQAKQQEGNPEILFSIKFLAPYNTTNMDQEYGDWVAVSPLQNLVDEYETLDGSDPDPKDVFKNKDLRLSQTIFQGKVDFGEGKVHNPSNNMPTTYGVKKFLSPDQIPYGYSTLSEQDWVMLRLSEVYLNYAEAENELAGPDATVLDAINSLRARGGLRTVEDAYPSLDKGSMREIIRHERRIELAFEGLRLYDLKRWGIAKEVLNKVTDGVLPYHYEDKHYVWPIPLDEIDKSNGVLKQNPDY